MADFNRATGGAGGDFGGIDFSKLGGGQFGAGEEEDDDDDSDDEMPPLENDDKEAGKKTEAEAAEAKPKA